MKFWMVLAAGLVTLSSFSAHSAETAFERKVLKRLIADSGSLTMEDPQNSTKTVSVNGLLARWLLDSNLKFGSIGCSEGTCTVYFVNAKPNPADIENGDLALGITFEVKTGPSGSPVIVPGSLTPFAAG